MGEGLVAGEKWPEPPDYHPPAATLQELVIGIRRFRAEQGLGPRYPLEVSITDPPGVLELWAVELVRDLC